MPRTQSINFTPSNNPINPVIKQNFDVYQTLINLIDDYNQQIGANKLAANSATLFYNVKTYGALGNGNNDDTTAIQAAINAAAVSGGRVYLPAGTYKITDVLTLASWVYIFGDSDASSTGASTIKQTTANKDVFRGTNTTSGMTNVVISNLRLEGTGSGTGNGIYLKNTGSGGSHPPFTYFSFRDLYIASMGNYGINVESLIVSVLDRIIVESCGNGFMFNGDAANTGYSTVNTSLTVNSCYANGIKSGIGYNVQSNTYLSFNACASDDNGKGYLVNLSNVIVFNGCGNEYANPTTASPGNAYTVTNSTQITFNTCYSYQCKASSWIVNTNSNATLISCQENTPISATASLNVDGSSTATTINCLFTTARTGFGVVTRMDNGTVITPQYTLADAATIAVDASLANQFHIALGGDRTISTPTNPTEGQFITFCLFASGGVNRTPTFGAGYRMGPFTLSAVISGKNDYLTFRYNSTDTLWDLLLYEKGY